MDGIRREVLEETGLTVEPLGVVEVFERIMPDAEGRPEYHYVLVDYLCRVMGGKLCAADDACRARWVARRMLPKYRITEGALPIDRESFPICMKTSSAEVLEFIPLKELIARYITSPLGRRELDRVEPSSDRAALESALADASEAMEYLRQARQPQAAARGAAMRMNFNTVPDLTATVHKLRIEGASLEPVEINDVVGMLDNAADAKYILTAVVERFPRLAARAQLIGEFRSLLRDVDGKIRPDGTLDDHASVALAPRPP